MKLNPITLPKHTRETTGSDIGQGAKFPTGLSEIRYVGIKIFDTSNGDPNKALAGAPGSVVNGLKNAFTSTSGATGSEKWVESAKNLVTEGMNVVGSGLDAISATGGALYDYAKDFEDAGNPPLKKVWKDTIWLPLPNDLTEDLSHSYDESGGLWDTAGKAVQAGVDAFIPGATPDLKGVLSPITGASNLVSMATGRQRILYNENKLVKFSGSAFRSITLTWSLIPNNHGESVAIQEIVTKLKAYSSPQHVASKLLLRAPFFCQLDFPNTYINDALQFKEVVMTNIQVNYSTSNAMETFSQDNMPKTMSLSITFKDREPKTLQNWAKGQGGYESLSQKIAEKTKTLNNPNATSEEDNMDYGHGGGGV